MNPIFSTDWFSHHIPIWTNILQELKGKPIEAIEIGSFEGRSSRWLMENVLTHPDAHLTCIDTFKGPITYKSPDFHNIFDIFNHNLQPFQTKLNVLVGDSRVIVPKLEEQYDFAYIDGSHKAADVLEDAIHVFRLLKPNGILIFDDYLWEKGGPLPIDNPKIAIDAFLSIYSDKLIVLHKDYQIIVRKL